MQNLISEWQSGDTEAFASLFRQYERMVYRTAYLITGDREAAKDVLQEVFVSVWKSRRSFNPELAKFTTWLHRITVNKCSRIRRRKNISFPSLEELREKSLQSNDSLSSVEDIMISRVEYDNFLHALNELDSKHRTVVVLRYFNDLSCDEVAGITGIPLGTVKSRLHYALKSLRQTLFAEEGGL
jgi:RNA polymerase sigma-70 factor (ECF subfamily)